MAESLLISISDIQTYREISATFKPARFNAFAMEIQRENLRNLLGQSLYKDFFDNVSVERYTNLLNAKEYTDSNNNTVQYYGLKPILCYWWLAVATREGDLFLSNHGAIELVNNPRQNFERYKEKERIAIGYMESAQNYANDSIEFLNENSATYPLWEGTNKKNATNFLTFRL